MTALGYRVIMTRTTDTELSSERGGSRKMQDLLGRLGDFREKSGHSVCEHTYEQVRK